MDNEKRLVTTVQRTDGEVKEIHLALDYSVGQFRVNVFHTSSGVAFAVEACPRKFHSHEREAARRYAYVELPPECLEELVPVLTAMRDQWRREQKEADDGD